MGVTPKHSITSLKMNGRLTNPLSFPQSLAGIHSLIKIGLLFMYGFS